jgi:hypothetical protein
MLTPYLSLVRSTVQLHSSTLSSSLVVAKRAELVEKAPRRLDNCVHDGGKAVVTDTHTHTHTHTHKHTHTYTHIEDEQRQRGGQEGPKEERKREEGEGKVTSKNCSSRALTHSSWRKRRRRKKGES